MSKCSLLALVALTNIAGGCENTDSPKPAASGSVGTASAHLKLEVTSLLRDPGRYAGSRVALYGYLRYVHEGIALVERREQASDPMFVGGVPLLNETCADGKVPSSRAYDRIEYYHGDYVVIEGEVTTSDMGLVYTVGLCDITRIHDAKPGAL